MFTLFCKQGKVSLDLICLGFIILWSENMLAPNRTLMYFFCDAGVTVMNFFYDGEE